MDDRYASGPHHFRLWTDHDAHRRSELIEQHEFATLTATAQRTRSA